jgi:hypothetical protein
MEVEDWGVRGKQKKERRRNVGSNLKGDKLKDTCVGQFKRTDSHGFESNIFARLQNAKNDPTDYSLTHSLTQPLRFTAHHQLPS